MSSSTTSPPSVSDHVAAFACRCSGEEIAKCDEVMTWTLEHLSSPGHPTTPENLISRVIYTLEFRYQAHITGIHADMWAVITASTYGDLAPERPFTTAIQCDELEDGLAFTFKAFYDRFGAGIDAETTE